MPTLKSGMLAYFDSYAGLVPCKVLAIEATKYGDYIAYIRYTAQRGPYSRGETGKHNALKVFPRDAVSRVRWQLFPRILPFSIVADQREGGANA